MDPNRLRELLLSVQEGQVSVDSALESLKNFPEADLDFARLDTHRHLRRGFPEVILGQGKTPEQVRSIFGKLADKNANVLATRGTTEMFEAVREDFPDAVYHPSSGAIVLEREPLQVNTRGTICVVSAGTSDIPVAEEAAVTARLMGNSVETVYDVGVAGIHRLLSRTEQIRKASVVVAVAGMEGALASVVGGLMDCPVIAVPTSIGYGANFQGLAALLAMLNSCADGVTVVNIDNGYGAGYAAALINRNRPQ